MPRFAGCWEFPPVGTHAWRDRPPSGRSKANAQLKAQIQRIHSRSRGTYGAPRVQAELVDESQRVSRKRVARLMREAGLEGVSRRRRTRTTRRELNSRRAPDLVDRNFTGQRPDELHPMATIAPASGAPPQKSSYQTPLDPITRPAGSRNSRPTIV